MPRRQNGICEKSLIRPRSKRRAARGHGRRTVHKRLSSACPQCDIHAAGPPILLVPILETLMQARRDILARIAALDRQIRVIARPHATVRLLMTAPGVRAFDDLDGPAPDGFQRIAQFWPRISAIGKDVAQHGIARGDGLQYIRRAVTILNSGAVDLKADEQSGRVGDDMALASLDPFTCVTTRNSFSLRGFYALAVDDAGRWLRCAGLGQARGLDEFSVDLIEQAVIAPRVEIAAHRRHRRKVTQATSATGNRSSSCKGSRRPVVRGPPCAPSSTATRKAASKTSCRGTSNSHQASPHRVTPSRLLLINRLGLLKEGMTCRATSAPREARHRHHMPPISA